MNRMLKGWEQTRRGERFQARIVAYADDFAILSRGRANEAPGWARGTPTRPGLTLNEAKTSVRNARQERFDFLGYTFGPPFGRRTGRESIGSMGRSARPAESETERLEGVLRTGESDEGV